MVPVSQVMFGSDYPYREAKEAVDGLGDYKFSDADRPPSTTRTRSG